MLYVEDNMNSSTLQQCCLFIKKDVWFQKDCDVGGKFEYVSHNSKRKSKFEMNQE